MIKKAINFQVSTEHINSWLVFMEPSVFLPMLTVSKILGGTWVGGTCEINRAYIKVYANRLNKVFLNDFKELVIPLTDIENIELERGFMSNIIIISFGNTFIKIRCFKANKFMQDIKDMIEEAT